MYTSMYTSPVAQNVSRFLSSRGWSRSFAVRNRRKQENTQGFKTKMVAGESTVQWLEDSREPGRAGYMEPTLSLEERLDALTKTLKQRYDVERRGSVLVVTQQTEKPALCFERIQTPMGREYRAETEDNRFVIRRHPDNPQKWELLVWSLKSVGFIDPIKVGDKVVYATCEDLKRDVEDDANTWWKNNG